MLILLNVLTYQHALENVFDTKCLSLELLGYLATSPEPGLPMPPRFFVGSDRSSMYGAAGFGIEEFDKYVLAAPHCCISDSIFGLHNVADPASHQFRNCHGVLSGVGCRNHLVKCTPCASLHEISCALMGYLDLVGAGHFEDSQRVRIADNLGVLVIGWALSDLRCYDRGCAD